VLVIVRVLMSVAARSMFMAGRGTSQRFIAMRVPHDADNSVHRLHGDGEEGEHGLETTKHNHTFR
jgi:hypothetical protein